MPFRRSPRALPLALAQPEAQAATALTDALVVDVRTDLLLACLWAGAAVLMLSAGVFDVGSLDAGAARHADAVAQTIGAGGPFP